MMQRCCGECAYFSPERKKCMVEMREVAESFRACIRFDEKKVNDDGVRMLSDV